MINICIQGPHKIRAITRVMNTLLRHRNGKMSPVMAIILVSLINIHKQRAIIQIRQYGM